MIDVILQPCKAGEDLVVIAGSKYLAHVAELVDAADSKSAIRKGVKVRFLSWAQKNFKEIWSFFMQITAYFCPSSTIYCYSYL